jgi:hypothetical protein
MRFQRHQRSKDWRVSGKTDYRKDWRLKLRHLQSIKALCGNVQTVKTLVFISDIHAIGDADSVSEHCEPWRPVATGNRNINLLSPEWNMAMKRMNLRKTLSAAALIGAMIVTTTALAQPSQGGNGPGYGMMGGNGPGWMDGYGFGGMGGYGGIWGPILLVIVIAGLVAWVVSQNRK